MHEETPNNPDGPLFRPEAVQAWRDRGDEIRGSLDVYPRWMRWALPGVVLLAGGFLAFAAFEKVPVRATGPAVVRDSASEDSLLIEAFLPPRYGDLLRPGIALEFRSRVESPPIRLTILSVHANAALDPPSAVGSAAAPPHVLVRAGARHAAPLRGARGSMSPQEGSVGTVQVFLGRESFLHMLRLGADRVRAVHD